MKSLSLNLPIHFQPGLLIVFEGLDDTGKSTQIARLSEATYTPQMGDPLFDPAPLFTHQPSGASGLGPAIYDLTEAVDWSEADPLTRQLLHLAAHNEHYEHDIIPALRRASVMMDRCWWSTYAYGFRGTVRERMTKNQFLQLAQLPTQGKMPDLVFLFMKRHGKKASDAFTSSDRVTAENYLELQEMYSASTVFIPTELSAAETQAFICGELYKRNYVGS